MLKNVKKAIPPNESPLPPIGKRMLACSWMRVNSWVAYLSAGGAWYLAFGDGPILNITHWMPLPVAAAERGGLTAPVIL